MPLPNQLRSRLFWIPLLLIALSTGLSFYFDARTRPGHIGESAAMNAGALLLACLLAGLVCAVLLMIRRSWIASLVLLAVSLTFLYKLLI